MAISRDRSAGAPEVQTDGEGRAQTMVKNDPRRPNDEKALVETDLTGTPISNEAGYEPAGTGETYVVLHHIVTTPQGGAFTRGQTVRESNFFTPLLDVNGRANGNFSKEIDPAVKARLFEEGNPALRKATKEEAKTSFVDLPDDEELARMQLAEAQAAESNVEIARLQTELAAANARAEAAEAKLQKGEK
jgi:hypothetical protein